MEVAMVSVAIMFVPPTLLQGATEPSTGTIRMRSFIYIYTYTHTHIYIYIYIYIFVGSTAGNGAVVLLMEKALGYLKYHHGLYYSILRRVRNLGHHQCPLVLLTFLQLVS